MELFEERGYARTTVEDIAARRSDGADLLPLLHRQAGSALFGISRARGADRGDHRRRPGLGAALTAVTRAFEALAPWFESRRDHARKRRTLIAAYAELGERELIKLSTLATAIAAVLRQRGLAAPTAALVAETSIAIFKNAFERWADDTRAQNFAVHVGGPSPPCGRRRGIAPAAVVVSGNAAARRARPKARR